jgi:tetratricopeptide (TPR) repeat protein
MWANITNLWGKKDDVDYMKDSHAVWEPATIDKTNTPIVETNNKTDTYELTESSPRTSAPATLQVKLWAHQEAMLHKIQEIENSNYQSISENTATLASRFLDKTNSLSSHSVCLGVMNDPPGSGKTYVILANILMDTNITGASIIIVPQNIYGQWQEAIKLIFKDTLHKNKFVKMYSDVLDIYSDPSSVNKYKVVLIQDNFADSYLKTLNDNDIGVYRIIIDEVDTMDKYVNSSVKTKYVWLVSASYTNQNKLGPYSIENKSKVICKCNPDFVAKSINLPKPNVTTIECFDEHIQVFNDIITYKEMMALNAGDLHILNRIMNVSGLVNNDNIKDTIVKYAEYMYGKTKQLEEAEEEYERLISVDEDERDNTYFNVLCKEISKLKDLREKSKLLKERLKELKEIKNTKETHLQNDFLEQMKESPQSKWLFFNDNGNVLIKYQEFLVKNGIKAVMLDGGNQHLIQKYLKEYKSGDTQVLLLNSMIEGAGMNLENTDTLVFMHKTEDKFVQQVVGRAQRYGRSTPLNIIMLFNVRE